MEDRRFLIKVFAGAVVLILIATYIVLAPIPSEQARQPEQYLGRSGDSQIKAASTTASGIAGASSSGAQSQNEEPFVLEAKRLALEADLALEAEKKRQEEAAKLVAERLAQEAEKKRQEEAAKKEAERLALEAKRLVLEADLALEAEEKRQEEAAAKKEAERLALKAEKKRQEEAAKREAERVALAAEKKRQEEADRKEAERLALAAEKKRQEEAAAKKEAERLASEAEKKRSSIPNANAVSPKVPAADYGALAGQQMMSQADTAAWNGGLDTSQAKIQSGPWPPAPSPAKAPAQPPASQAPAPTLLEAANAERLAPEAEKKRQKEAAKKDAERLALAAEEKRQEEADRKDAERLALVAEKKRQEELTAPRANAAGKAQATAKTVGPASAPESTLGPWVTGTQNSQVTAVQGGAATAVSADLPVFAPSRVVLIYPRNDKAAAERTTALRQALTAAKVEVVKVEAVDTSRPTPGIGYYFRSDHDAAVDVSHRVQPLLGPVEPALLELRGKVPPPGTVEIAVPGRDELRLAPDWPHLRLRTDWR